MTISVASKTDQNLTNGTALTYGLVGMWHLDEGTGATTYDASGQGRTGTLFNTPTWVQGVYGRALHFVTASDQGVQTLSLAFTNSAISFSFWINTDAPGGQVIIGDASQSGTVGYVLIHLSGNDLIYQYANGVNPVWAGSSNFFGSSGEYYDTWVHVTIVADYSANTIAFYRNGAPYSSAGMTTPVYPSTNRAYYLGTYATGYGNGITGTLDEVRFYNRGLSVTEAAQLYNEGAPSVIINNETDIVDIVPLSGAVGIWHFDEGTGTYAYDSSLYANTGTLGGSPVWTIGKFGNALNFSGSNYVTVPYSPSLSVSQITLSLWIKRARSGTREIFIGKANGSGPGTSPYWIEFTVGDDVLMLLGDGSHDKSVYGPATISDTNWHFIVGTFNGSTETLYLDGVAGTPLSWSGTIYQDTTSLGIGRLGTYGGLMFDGTIDEVRLYNRGLSTTEIAQLYSEGNQSGDFIVESFLDLRNMVSGDTVVVREYTAVDDSNSHIYQQATISGTQVSPLIRFHGKTFYKGNLYRVTLKQTGGTGKSYPVTTSMQVLSS